MTSQFISRGSRSCPEVYKLRLLIKEIQKGVEGIGLRRQLRPENVMRVSTSLRDGGRDEISQLMKDVAGESLSLCAGSSMFGAQAMDAISDAQAESILHLRNQLRPFDLKPTIEAGARQLLLAHQESLLHWVETGVAGSDYPQEPSDLTQIGQKILLTPALRQSAISVFIASTETIRVSLGLVG